MNKKLLIAFAIGLLNSLLQTGCDSKKTEDSVKIGVVYNLSGEQQALDIPSMEGAIVATKEINNSGGILGRKLELISIDGKSQIPTIKQKILEQIKNNPDMSTIIGLSDTDFVLSSAKIAADNERLFITSGATSPLLPKQIPHYLFLSCFGDNVQAAAAAQWAVSSLKAKTAAVIYDQDKEYTRLLHGYFETSFKALGGKIVASIGYNSKTLKDVIENLPKADIIYFSAVPDDVIGGINFIRKTGYQDPIVGGDGLDIGDEWKTNPNIKNVYFTTHAYLGADSKSSAIKLFRKKFTKTYPNKEPDAFTALGYDSLHLVAKAIEKAGNTEVESIRKALFNIGEFKGISGNIKFVNDKTIPEKEVTLLEVKSGQELFVDQILPTTIPTP